jgi:hypothetical protein
MLVRAIVGCGLLIAGLSAVLLPAHASNSVTLSAQRDAQSEREIDAEVKAAFDMVARRDWSRALNAWTELALKGNREAPGQLCTLHFDGRQGSFDVPQVLSWCRRASALGDAGALYRMGLFYFFGVGVSRNVAQADAFCNAADARSADVPVQLCLSVIAREKARAQSAQGDGAVVGLMTLAGLSGPRDLDTAESGCSLLDEHNPGRVSLGFCLAAIEALRTAGDADLAGRPARASTRASTEVYPVELDRSLEVQHRTATGLGYTCREILNWTRFEAPGLSIVRPSDRVFGKIITEYGAGDFAELDRAAAGCMTAIAATDRGGALRAQFAAFHGAWNELRARQVALLMERDRMNEDSRQRLEQNASRTNVIVTSSGETQQEKACFSAVQRVWLTQGDARRNDLALEIRDSALSEERGNYVVRGQARVLDISAGSRETRSSTRYTCSFVGRTSLVASSVLTPLAVSP